MREREGVCVWGGGGGERQREKARTRHTYTQCHTHTIIINSYLTVIGGCMTSIASDYLMLTHTHTHPIAYNSLIKTLVARQF